jgi:D-lactate dehydrogenase
LSNSDIITLHAPLTDENKHLINKDSISKMKKGVIIINTARGELIDTEALIWGLKEKIVAGAGIDVLEGERDLKEEMEILTFDDKERSIDYKALLEDHVLIDMDNVIVTPHLAFYTQEAERRIYDTVVENIRSFIAGEPKNLVK